jgi:hypothetical protein
MPGERLRRILAELGAGDGLSAARLCAVFPQIAGVTGAGVMLMSGDVPRGSLCSSNDVSQLIEDPQYTLGEGSVQADISVAEALIRLRAFAFSHDRQLADVAQDVIDRKLRLR